MNENQPTLEDPKIRGVYQYWLARCRDGKLPARSDIEPLDLADVLPHLILVDVTHAPFEMRYRLVGTWICEHGGRDPMGENLEAAHFSSNWAKTRAEYMNAIESDEPVFASARPIDVGKEFVPINRVFLPLAGPDGQVNMVLVCVSPVEPD